MSKDSNTNSNENEAEEKASQVETLPKVPSTNETSTPSTNTMSLDDHQMWGESTTSLDANFLLEGTHPESKQPDQAQRPPAWSSPTTCNNNNGNSEEPTSAKTSLLDIMNEQEEERKTEEEIQLENLRIVEEAQEEEMIRLALENSISDFNQSATNLSLSERDAEYALRFQAEVERTEKFVESPHTAATAGASSRSSTITSPSGRPVNRWDGQRSMIPRWDSQRSMSTSSRNSAAGNPLPIPPFIRRSSRSISPPHSQRSLSGAGQINAQSLSGRAAVLEVAKRHLSPMEVELIEKSLRAGILRHPHSFDPHAADPRPHPVASMYNLERDKISPQESQRMAHILRQLGPDLPTYFESDVGKPSVPERRAVSTTVPNVRPSIPERRSVSTAAAPSANSAGMIYNLDGAHEHLSPQELAEIEQALRGHVQSSSTAAQPASIAASSAQPQSPSSRPNTASSAATTKSPKPLSSEYDLSGAEENLTEEELRQIQAALGESEAPPTVEDDLDRKPSSCLPADSTSNAAEGLSEEEAAAIEKALREADADEEAKSLQLALQIQQEEERLQRMNTACRQQQGNVRTMTRAELTAEQTSGRVGAFQAVGVPKHPLEEAEELSTQAGFRINSSERQEWSRRDQNSVVGPNNEIRTKHDLDLQGQANAHRLGLDVDEDGSLTRVGNRAYNSFMQSVKRNKKGVAAHGTGRAGSDTDGTKGGAMDPGVRLQITKAINSGLIERCNGVVKEGKEAVVYHADKGEASEGFDVAIKVFKRIQEFRGRGDYVDGDPRYARTSFKKAGSREQLEMWAEKEFRNLVRANRAGVPVATPLLQKDNTLFMRFLGTDGWPAPQLRELNLRKGSKRWETLYNQVMGAIRRLYNKGGLVHGDLSEYNIMVVPAFLVDNRAADIDNEQEELQAVLIDFGQAVDPRHPEASNLLKRDLDRVLLFFQRQGIKTMSIDEAVAFVLDDDE